MWGAPLTRLCDPLPRACAAAGGVCVCIMPNPNPIRKHGILRKHGTSSQGDPKANPISRRAGRGIHPQ